MKLLLDNNFISEHTFPLSHMPLNGGQDSNYFKGASFLGETTGFYVWRQNSRDNNGKIVDGRGGYGEKKQTTMLDIDIDAFDRYVDVGNDIIKSLTGEEKEPTFKVINEGVFF